jgi:hypothetical protein
MCYNCTEYTSQCHVRQQRVESQPQQLTCNSTYTSTSRHSYRTPTCVPGRLSMQDAVHKQQVNTKQQKIMKPHPCARPRVHASLPCTSNRLTTIIVVKKRRYTKAHLCARPRVHAKMLATGLVLVGLPFWCSRQWRVTVPAGAASKQQHIISNKHRVQRVILAAIASSSADDRRFY